MLTASLTKHRYVAKTAAAARIVLAEVTYMPSLGLDNSLTRSAIADSKLLLRAESDFAETASVAPSTSSWSSASTSSRSSSGGKPSTDRSASLATSCVSLRDLEHRKNQIELELARVQHELQLRESQRDGRKPYSTVTNGKTGGEMK